ncbi:MAG: NFACT family protein [Candidatus Woesearchaeota archaeon]
MPKKFLSSLEITALVNELQSLVNAKINQIYHFDEEVIIQLHKEGKQMLRVIPGKFINITAEKKTALKPSSFCMQLRKYLAVAFIRKIYQHDSERIVIFEIEKKEKYFLIIELFPPGNLILTDEKYMTIAALKQQKFRDRFIKPGEKYVFPNPSFNWKELTEKKLGEILSKSEKKNLAASLATEVGFGGLYAEEICKLSSIDKNLATAEVSKEHLKEIVAAIKRILKSIETPAGFIYEEQVTPFALSGLKSIKEFADYNSAVDTLKPVKTSPQEKKIKSVERIIADQEDSIKKQEQEIELNNQKAELVYSHYQPLSKLLEIVKEMKKNKTWEEIKKELEKEKKIKKVDLINKKVVVEL